MTKLSLQEGSLHRAKFNFERVKRIAKYPVAEKQAYAKNKKRIENVFKVLCQKYFDHKACQALNYLKTIQ